MPLPTGTRIIYEGGYRDSLFRFPGVILGPATEWSWLRNRTVFRRDLWQAKLETGSYVSGYEEQFTPNA